jgi:flagellar L-ring protein precursor FlgH
MILTNRLCSLLALALVALPTGSRAQNLYARARRPVASIGDTRATSIGDILTVVIHEGTKLKQEDKVNRTNSTTLSARLESFNLDNLFSGGKLPTIDARQSRSMDANAKQEKDSTIQTKIAVIVVDVQPNGNLIVAGSRTVTIDDEEKMFRISGLVRPLDIGRDNTVLSSMVADARVAITGEGGNTRMTTRGPIGTFFDTLMWVVWPL